MGNSHRNPVSGKGRYGLDQDVRICGGLTGAFTGIGFILLAVSRDRTAILLATYLLASEFHLLAADVIGITTVAGSEPLTLTTCQLAGAELIVRNPAFTELLWRFGF